MRKLFHVFVEMDGHYIGRVWLQEPYEYLKPVKVGDIDTSNFQNRLRLADVEIDIDVPSNEALTDMLKEHKQAFKEARKQKLLNELKELENEVA